MTEPWKFGLALVRKDGVGAAADRAKLDLAAFDAVLARCDVAGRASRDGTHKPQKEALTGIEHPKADDHERSASEVDAEQRSGLRAKAFTPAGREISEALQRDMAASFVRNGSLDEVDGSQARLPESLFAAGLITKRPAGVPKLALSALPPRSVARAGYAVGSQALVNGVVQPVRAVPVIERAGSLSHDASVKEAASAQPEGYKPLYGGAIHVSNIVSRTPLHRADQPLEGEAGAPQPDLSDVAREAVSRRQSQQDPVVSLQASVNSIEAGFHLNTVSPSDMPETQLGDPSTAHRGLRGRLQAAPATSRAPVEWDESFSPQLTPSSDDAAGSTATAATQQLASRIADGPALPPQVESSSNQSNYDTDTGEQTHEPIGGDVFLDGALLEGVMYFAEAWV